MNKVFGKNKNIVFEKGDTLGGTAPLLLLNQVKGGRDRRSITNRRGRKKGSSLGAWLSTIITVVVLFTLIFAGLKMFSEVNQMDRFQGIFGSGPQ